MKAIGLSWVIWGRGANMIPRTDRREQEAWKSQFRDAVAQESIQQAAGAHEGTRCTNWPPWGREPQEDAAKL